MDPSDAEVEAALRAAPDTAWHDLAAAVDAVEAEDVHARWEGGPREDGTVQMPYPVYSEAVQRLRGALGAVGAVVVFAWPRWEGGARYRDPAALARAPVADAARVVTSILRSERFGDGAIEAGLGHLLAAARRLLAWRVSEATAP